MHEWLDWYALATLAILATIAILAILAKPTRPTRPCNTRAKYQTLHGFTYCAVLTASNTPDSGIPYPVVVPPAQETIYSVPT